MQQILFVKLLVGVIATLALYSILYRENKFYRVVEHIYIGLSVGYAVFALWKETLDGTWWKPMIGTAPTPDSPLGLPGFYLYAFLLPLGLMAYFVFSPKHNWMSKIPIGIILGAWGGQELTTFWKTVGPQVEQSMRPILPSTTSSLTVPYSINLQPETLTQIAEATKLSPQVVTQLAGNTAISPTQINAIAGQAGVGPDVIQAAIGQINGVIGSEVYTSQAINNVIYLITLISVLTYFLFSVEQKGKFLQGFTRTGRWLLMVGFGAIFGSTVMTRFALVIDRLNFVFIEFLRNEVFKLG
jgi:hypothetical protein